MAGAMIGAGPHKASHTAVTISGAEEPLGELRVRASAVQAERLLEWASRYNGPGNGGDFATSVTVSRDGTVFVTGTSKGAGTGFDYATIAYRG